MDKPRGIRIRCGDVFAVPLGDNAGFGYCRYLDRLVTEFFDLCSPQFLPTEEVVNTKVAFVVWASKKPFTSGAWPRIGHAHIPPRRSPIFYKQDPISKRLFLCQDAKETPATLAECEGLECAAVWREDHLIDRLRDHFAGQPCRWVESLKPKLI